MSGRGLSDRVAHLSAAKRALLERRLRGESPRQVRRDNSREEKGELSTAELRLWFLHQLNPRSVEYHISKTVRLRGRLDAAALERAFVEIWRRHETLRTVFRVSEGRPFCEVGPVPDSALMRVDLSGLRAEVRERESRALAQREVRRPFLLDSGQLLRVRLMRLTSTDHVVNMVMHHIASDGWSFSVLIGDLCRLYNAFCRGMPSPLEALPLQYRDYARLERNDLAERLPELLDYWERRLRGAPEALDLPRQREVAPGIAGPSVQRRLSPDLAALLDSYGRSAGVTRFVILLAAYYVLLQRFAGQSDLVVGTPIANRERPGVDRLVGFFINVLALRANLAGNPTFESFVATVREHAREAFEHQDLPFGRLVQELRPERSVDRTPIFQTLFALQVAPSGIPDMDGLEMSNVDLPAAAPTYDLVLSVKERPEGLLCVAEFNPGKLNAGLVRSMLTSYEALLRDGLTHPSKRLADLRHADSPDGHGPSPPPRAADESVSDLFSAQCRRAPDRVALVCEEGQVTYGVLLKRAWSLAAQMRARGVGEETLVGVSLPRSIELVAALLAIDMLRAAYLPLDSQQAPERLRNILKEARPELVLSSVAAELPAPDPGRAQAHGASRVYVMPTSGSTGQPKCVICVRESLVNFLLSIKERIGFDEHDVWLAATRLSFDISALEIFGPLISGGKLVLAPEAGSAGLPADLIRREAATVLQATPSGWRALVGTGWEGAHGAKVLCGGEPLTADLANALLARAGEVWNVYGPTETTIWAGASRVRPGLAMPSIGGPLADTQFRVLDESLCPVPVGRTGELCIGGVLLARGYLRRPDLTAECFVPDPFGGNGARLYRTGDLVRAREDGEFDFLGRRDSQVKIRGHRVELGEVETALRSLPEVCEAAVLAPKDAVNGSHHLVAYLRLNPGTDLALADVRQRLRTLLPDPMIPSVFVKVPEFPLTPNGKLDRKMLLQTQGERLAPAHFEAPATECEVALAGIWADVLGISGPGIHDNFFELGGDSMRAVEVAARARTAGMRFEVADLFRHQTIEELAAVTVVETGAPAKMEPFALLSPEDRARIPEDVEEAYPISRLQAHMLLESERQPERGAYHNLLSLELRAALEPGRVAGALDSLISQHPVLRTAFELYCYSEPVQVIYKMAGAEFTTSDLRALDERERKQRVADRIRMEHRRRFAMNRPPLLRCHLDLLDEQRVQLTLVNHHAILDGWSRSLLVTELIARSLGPDVQAALAPHPNVFRDYVSREREGERDPSAIAFWREKLKGAPVTRLPGASAAGGSRDRITRAVPVPAEWSLRLREVAAERGVPLKTLLLAVHLRALSRLTAQPEVVTGVVVNLRPAQVGSAEALGLFLNTLPLRARTGLDWPDLVREALEGESQLLQFGHVPSARLPAASALYDTVFNFVEYRNYRKLDLHDQCEVLSATPMEETGIGFVANFGLDAFSDQVGLVLESGSGYLDASQLDRISEVYVEQLQTLCGGTLARRQKPLVHAAIEQRAGTNGDRIAIVDGDQQISYRMLDTTADRLAETLAARGVGPESIVGVSAERTVEMPCALLAVLKAGAAYLPLDPADPADRLRHMIEEAGVRIVLARAAEAGAFLPLGVEVIPTDPAASPPAVPKVPPDSSNAAYIIYTSGSSGAPKGVVVEHRSLAAYSAAAVDMFNLRPGDRVLQFASIMFDAAAEEIYPTLSAGATLVLRPRDGLVSIPAFVGMCHESSVTMLDLPTAFWHLLTEECGTQLELPAVRLVIVGGEAIRPEVLRRWRQVVRREIGLVNTYGPTEGTIVAVCCRLAGEGSAEYDGGPVAIGRPVPGVRTYLLNDDLSRVPEGAAGELYIAGTGLARGYLNRPDLTAARFLPDPYAEAQGERMYRTGDRCYRAADGALVFIGRQDRQIKFRGFRIELDEIEECLLRDPEVLAAVVLAVNAGTEQARIVALVLPRHADSRAGLARRLRESIASRLPAYCVPSEIRLVEHLPRASSGKIDRGALSALLESGPVPEGRPPSTPVEGVIASIWEELLGVEAVQRDDNFFDLGGHSLAALRLLSRLREAFGIELRLHELFESQVLSALASAVERARGRAAQRYEAPKPVAIDQVVPLSYEQSDIWVQNQATGSSRLFNMPMAAMLTGPLDAGALRASLKEIVRRHTILRTIFTSRRGVVEQVVLPPDAFDMDTLDWTGMEADERLVVEESCLPFDLEREIPFRSVLVRLSAERHLLLITMHHIASDGWSLQVLFQELSLLYSAFSSCNSAEMPKLPIQYRDYAAWQRQRMLAGDFEGDLGFWGEYLKDMKPAKSWSCEDANREPSLLYDQCSRTFGPERLAELRALARSRQCTLFMVLLAAFGVLNSRQNGEEDFRAGTLIANRNLPETERLIGMFANTLLLRVRLSGLQSFSELLHRVRKSSIEAYEHREVPFEAVLERLYPEDERRENLFRVMLLMNNLPVRHPRFGDVDVAPFRGDDVGAKPRVMLSSYELILNIVEHDEGLTIHTRYDAGRMERTTAEMLLEDFDRLLATVVEIPEVPLGALKAWRACQG